MYISKFRKRNAVMLSALVFTTLFAGSAAQAEEAEEAQVYGLEAGVAYDLDLTGTGRQSSSSGRRPKRSLMIQKQPDRRYWISM